MIERMGHWNAGPKYGLFDANVSNLVDYSWITALSGSDTGGTLVGVLSLRKPDWRERGQIGPGKR